MSESDVEIELEISGEERRRVVLPPEESESEEQPIVVTESEGEGAESSPQRKTAKPPGNPETIRNK